MRRACALLVCLWVTSCARCSSAGGHDAAHVKHSTDLHSALMVMFPENRGVAITQGRAVLKRRLTGKADWRALLATTLMKNGFAPDDAGTGGVRAPYHVTLDIADDESAVYSVEVPLDADAIERIFNSPFSMSTGELGLMLPRAEPGRAAVAHEDFELTMSYWARPGRAAFLTRQLIELNLGNLQWTHRGLPDAGWEPPKPDGGYGPVPEQFEVTLDSKPDGAVMQLKRDGKNVELRYSLVTEG